MTSNLPTKKEIRDFIEQAQARGGKTQITRREIARAFNIKGEDRTILRQALKEMEADGMIDMTSGKKMSAAGTLPPVIVLDAMALDNEGDIQCTPSNWRENFAAPAITLPHKAAAKTKPPVGVGDRFVGKMTMQPDGTYTTTPIKVIGEGAERILGIYSPRKVGGVVEPVSRKQRRGLIIGEGDDNGASEGDLVWAELTRQKSYGPKYGRVREILGKVDDPSAYSLIAVAAYDIPIDFPEAVQKEADNAKLPALESREDLRDLPLVTIDPADARDHDDAIFAESDPSSDNKDGWRVIVAIADVSYFVRPGSALDDEARKRGNSTYLPDRVVPMLPERLSNDLCSLKEGLDRPCLAVELRFDKKGDKISHRFLRALMKSHAGLSYEEAQAGFEGTPNARTAKLMKSVLTPLWGAYQAVNEARTRRHPLELDLPERKIIFGEDGLVKNVVLRERFDAHKLVEEFMIQANVAAAEALSATKLPFILRVHDEPDPERLDGIRDYLESLGYSLPKGQVLKPRNLNTILAKAAEGDEASMISQVLLRAQRQAVYSIDNLGHFGLNLRHYAHFTSPIRRYADLTVHRALVSAGKLGTGGQTSEEAFSLQRTAEDISDLERRSMKAERESTDRFLAAHLSEKVGVTFAARINGVTKSGLFVTLDDTGADGFIPMKHVGFEYFQHIETMHTLVGETTKGVYRIGMPVEVKLLEVTPLQGGLLFEMLSEPLKGIEIPKSARRPSHNKYRGGKKAAGKKVAGKSNKHKRKMDASAGKKKSKKKPSKKRK